MRVEVEPIGEAQESQTFPKVTDNDIRWYTVQLNTTDTISLHTSVNCTLQVFSPTAQEVYKADGTGSTEGGFHPSVAGTYYLAVHSATGSGNMTLYVEKYSYLLGDVNCDKEVTTDDIDALAQVIVGRQTCKNPKNADLNGDSEVSIADLTLLVNQFKGRQPNN